MIVHDDATDNTPPLRTRSQSQHIQRTYRRRSSAYEKDTNSGTPTRYGTRYGTRHSNRKRHKPFRSTSAADIWDDEIEMNGNTNWNHNHGVTKKKDKTVTYANAKRGSESKINEDNEWKSKKILKHAQSQRLPEVSVHVVCAVCVRFFDPCTADFGSLSIHCRTVTTTAIQALPN